MRHHTDPAIGHDRSVPQDEDKQRPREGRPNARLEPILGEEHGLRLEQGLTEAAEAFLNGSGQPEDGQSRVQPPPGEEAQIARLFEMTNDLLTTITLDGRFTLLNPAWEHLLGWTREELRARPVQELIHPDDIEQTMALTLAGRHRPARLHNFTNRYRHRDGSWRWLLWSARCDGEVWYAAAKDVTDRMWLERQALHDPLTKLPNRLLLMDRARQAIARLRRSHGLIALLFIDLDRFKAINDNLGHAVGDHLLISVSERLAEMLRDCDTVARLGGDEFVILAEELESDAEALAVAERVLHALEAPFLVGSAEVSMLASVGVSVSHDPEADPEGLLREADVAMYRAKGAGGHSLELFDEDLRREVTARLEIESRLRHALPREELQLLYQPLLSLLDGSAIGCEALVRWHPRGAEPMSPPTFLTLAEESQLIAQIGEWVLRDACAQAAAWRRDGGELTVSVNVSARELVEVDLAGRVRDALARSDLPGRALCLEVTEDAILCDPERAKAALAEVRRLGVRISLDNFGAGQSSLSLLSSLPVDTIKIDRGLVQELTHDGDKRAMVVAMIALAREAGLGTVAVGIETESQLALVQELGCTVGQGFLLHEPQAPEHLHLREPVAIGSGAQWRPFARLRHRH
jgi:diguanylate cyclase (GGDEF)-like protein/PAS domain S-box-containing protein